MKGRSTTYISAHFSRTLLFYPSASFKRDTSFNDFATCFRRLALLSLSVSGCITGRQPGACGLRLLFDQEKTTAITLKLKLHSTMGRSSWSSHDGVATRRSVTRWKLDAHLGGLLIYRTIEAMLSLHAPDSL